MARTLRYRIWRSLLSYYIKSQYPQKTCSLSN